MPIQFTCTHCGSLFNADSKKRPRKYCSNACARVGRIRPVEERFWEKVRVAGPDDCWVWTAGRFKSGYGSFDQFPAHRTAWALTHGPIPDGLVVCHNCPDGDNRLCVNPAHMFLGTHTDNNADMRAKGRASVGEMQPSSKLTVEDVQEIRRRFAAGGISQNALAREYGVCGQLVNGIIARKRWKHV